MPGGLFIMTRKQISINKFNREIKKARKRLARYELGLERNEHTKIDAFETLKRTLESWERGNLFTKSGDIRKNISYNKFVMVRSLVNATLLNKQSEYNKYKTVKSRTRNIPHITRNLAKQWDMTEQEVKRFIHLSTGLQNTALYETLGLDSEQVRRIADEHDDINLDTLEKVAEYLIKDKNRNTPKFMKSSLRTDDYFNALNEILTRVQNLPDKLKQASIEKILKDEEIIKQIERDKAKDYTANVFN